MELSVAKKIKKLWNDGLRHQGGAGEFPFGEAQVKFANDCDDIYVVIYIARNVSDAIIFNKDFQKIKLFLSEMNNLGKFDASFFIRKTEDCKDTYLNGNGVVLSKFDMVIYLNDEE